MICWIKNKYNKFTDYFKNVQWCNLCVIYLIISMGPILLVLLFYSQITYNKHEDLGQF